MPGRTTAGTALTLLEVGLILALLVLAWSIANVYTQGRSEDLQLLEARQQITEFSKALELFRMENGFYPSNEEGLNALVARTERAKTWPKAGYLASQAVPKDPWGNPYVYLSPGSHNQNYDILCYGADGVSGGDGYDGDITSYDDE